MDAKLLQEFADFKRCAVEAPEGCYQQAKQLNDVLEQAREVLLQGLRDIGLQADACGMISAAEASMYDCARRSNPAATVFPSAEGFGRSLGGPARERVLAQAVRERDFLRSMHPPVTPGLDACVVVKSDAATSAGAAPAPMPTPWPDCIQDRLILKIDALDRQASEFKRSGKHMRAAECRSAAGTLDIVLAWIDKGVPLRQPKPLTTRSPK